VDEEKQRRRILFVLAAVSLLFLVVPTWLTWFEVFGKQAVIGNSYNRRLTQENASIRRGSIFDRNGKILAETLASGERSYPEKWRYSQVIGYNSNEYGKTMLEARYNNELAALGDLGRIVGMAEGVVRGEKAQGLDVYLTLDDRLQRLAQEALGNRHGAVVAVNPKTGEVYALVSNPVFNPEAEALAAGWQDLIANDSKPLLPRAIQGLYAPGSTFKAVVAGAAIDNGLAEFTVEDQGSVVIDGQTLSNDGQKSYGKIGLTEAMTVSSNVYFGSLGIELGQQGMDSMLSKTLATGLQPFDLNVAKAAFGEAKAMNLNELAATAIGQGKTLVTPLHMAVIAAGIANGGVEMKPYIVRKVASKEGFVLWLEKPVQQRRIMSQMAAAQVTAMMQNVVDQGTGMRAQIRNIAVAGKTGTAQNERSIAGEGDAHAWFIGFAPAQDPQIAVAVLLEYSGSSGGRSAAPIAREVMADWLKR